MLIGITRPMISEITSYYIVLGLGARCYFFFLPLKKYLHLLCEMNEVCFWECSLYLRKVICRQQLNKVSFAILLSFLDFILLITPGQCLNCLLRKRKSIYGILMQMISRIDPFEYSYQMWLIKNTFDPNKQARQQNTTHRIIVVIQAW